MSEQARKTLEQLDEALELLDHELEGLDLGQPLQIRAIGGYALMRRGIRAEDRAFTVDIDTLTNDYQREVLDAIKTVAERLDLDPGWLNNDAVLDNDAEMARMLIEARFDKTNDSMKNIDMGIADVPTLTRSKIIAANDHELSGRTQDLADLKELLAHQGITRMTQFRAKYPDEYGEYEVVDAALSEHFASLPTTQASASTPVRARMDRLGAAIEQSRTRVGLDHETVTSYNDLSL